MRKLSNVSDSIYRKAIKAIASDYFFYGVVGLLVLQALWYAFSFVPWINDEARHFENIAIYSHRLSPFLGKQPAVWDRLGAITRDGSFMFYYIMSWPLRFIRLFTQDYTAQIISLRLLCIAFFATGIVIYRKALLEITKLPKSVLHVLFLLLVTIPTVAILPATINYDNLAFPLFAVILLLTLRVIKNPNADFVQLGTIIALGLLLSMVKWTDVGLFAPVFLYLCYNQYKRHNLSTFSKLIYSARQANKYQTVLVSVFLVVMLGLFIERPIMNVLKYGRPEPSCPAIIGVQRCMAFRDYAAYADIKAHKPADFHPANPVNYVIIYWIPNMVDTADNLFEQGVATELPIIVSFYSLIVLAGIVLLLVYLRDIWRVKTFRTLMFFSALYLIFLIFDEYQGAYVTYGAPTAIRARYLIPILPIFMYLVAFACIGLWGKYRKALLLVACLIVLISTQGGGIITYSLTSPQKAYWPNTRVRSVNTKLQNILHPLVKE